MKIIKLQKVILGDAEIVRVTYFNFWGLKVVRDVARADGGKSHFFRYLDTGLWVAEGEDTLRAFLSSGEKEYIVNKS